MGNAGHVSLLTVRTLLQPQLVSLKEFIRWMLLPEEAPSALTGCKF